jgi:hypothetical protein
MKDDITLIVIAFGLVVMGFLVTPWILQLLFGIAGGLCLALYCENRHEL